MTKWQTLIFQSCSMWKILSLTGVFRNYLKKSERKIIWYVEFQITPSLPIRFPKILINIRITHSYLLAPHPESPPSCPHCSSPHLTVDHFFSCPSLLLIRNSLHVSSSILQSLKNDSDTVDLTLQYLRSSNFYSNIKIISLLFPELFNTCAALNFTPLSNPNHIH